MSLKKYHSEVVWAARYILKKVGKRKLHVEEMVSVMRDGKEVTFGTLDAYCEGNLFDLKTGRRRNYREQMAAYAIGAMQRFGDKKLTCHLVYSRLREVETFDLTYDEACDIVYGIADSVHDPTRSPWPCEYCVWCKHKETCSGLNQYAYSIAGQLEAMSKVNLNAPLKPAAQKRLAEIVSAMEGWVDRMRGKIKE